MTHVSTRHLSCICAGQCIEWKSDTTSQGLTMTYWQYGASNRSKGGDLVQCTAS